jgi:hypothetical protein
MVDAFGKLAMQPPRVNHPRSNLLQPPDLHSQALSGMKVALAADQTEDVSKANLGGRMELHHNPDS